uniref:Fibronectin type-III domain-containing protein n=1 Tax=Parascaris equorum TaxID=6256 RepID=A0A914REP9_PAREQ
MFFIVTNLDPMAEYEFRVLAANSAVPSMTGCHLLLTRRVTGKWRGTAPGRPYVSAMDTDRVTIEWAPAIADPDSAPVAGYQVRLAPIE